MILYRARTRCMRRRPRYAGLPRSRNEGWWVATLCLFARLFSSMARPFACSEPSLDSSVTPRKPTSTRAPTAIITGARSEARVAEAGSPRRRELHAHQVETARAQSLDGMRGGQVSQHWRVLGWRGGPCGDGDHHADGGYMHAWVPVLRSQDVQRAATAGSSRAREYGAGGGRVGYRLCGADVGRPG